jgi:hypothetical protein
MSSGSGSGEGKRSRVRQQIDVSELLDCVVKTSGNLTAIDRAEIEGFRTKPNVERILALIRQVDARQSPSYARVCQQLRGHVQFLSHLAESPELLSLFLVSQRDGGTMVPITAKNLMLEQAHRTTLFLAEAPENGAAQVVATIEEQLGIGFDPADREKNLRRFLEDKITDSRELTELLYQELVICDALQRFSAKLRGGAVGVDIDSVRRPHKDGVGSGKERPSGRIEAQIRARTENELRESIRAELREELERKQAVRAQTDAGIVSEIRAQTERELRSQLREEITAELLPQLSKRLRKDITAELTPQIRREVESTILADVQGKIRQETIQETRAQLRKEVIETLTPQITQDVRGKLEPQIREEVRSEIEERIRRDTRKQLTSVIKAEVEAELKPKLTALVTSELTPKIEKEARVRLTQSIRNELQTELEGRLRDQLTQELRPVIENEQKRKLVPVLTRQIQSKLQPRLEEKLRKEISAQEKTAAANEIETARESLRAQLEQEMTRQFERRLEKERLQLESEVRENVRESLRLELLSERAPITAGGPNESEFVDLFGLICRANGDPSPEFSWPHLREEGRQLAGDVIQLREAFAFPTGPLVRFFSELQFENSHLGQLHTQTRSLLVRQAHMITELRKHAQSSAWAMWAKHVYALINGEHLKSDEVSVVKAAVEQSITHRLGNIAR